MGPERFHWMVLAEVGGSLMPLPYLPNMGVALPATLFAEWRPALHDAEMEAKVEAAPNDFFRSEFSAEGETPVPLLFDARRKLTDKSLYLLCQTPVLTRAGSYSLSLYYGEVLIATEVLNLRAPASK